MKRIDGFLFDLDGVLIDSEKEYTRIWEAIDRQWPTGIAGFAHIIKGTTLPNILSTYFPEELHERINGVLHRMQSEMQFYYAPGARNFLLKLRSAGIPAAIVTSSDNRKMTLLWQQLPELHTLVDVVIDANDISRSKPDPEGYLLAASKLGVDPCECVVAEDAVLGARAGKSAGAFVLGIAATMGREAMEREADHVVDTLEDALFMDWF